MEIFEAESSIKRPPKATLARRAKSYSDFYEAIVGYFDKGAEKEKPKDVLEVFENREIKVLFEGRYKEYENELLDISHEEY